jgi:hypothetical protein
MENGQKEEVVKIVKVNGIVKIVKVEFKATSYCQMLCFCQIVATTSSLAHYPAFIVCLVTTLFKK